MGNVLICGSSGFIGHTLRKYLLDKGYGVKTLDRTSQNHQQSFVWNFENENAVPLEALKDVNTIINLAGANIGQSRWTKKRKEEIKRSRTLPAENLAQALRAYRLSIDTYISSSAVGYYGAYTHEKVYTEKDKAGRGFLGSVCLDWEHSTAQFEDVSKRIIILRKGVVLGREGGMYKRLLPLARLGINTCIGSGNQYLPWIHIMDLIRIYDFFIKHEEIEGIFNVASPQYIQMKDFAKELSESISKKRWTPAAPLFAARLLFGEMSKMITEGSRVNIKKLRDTGFEFHFPVLKEALQDLAR